VDPEPERTADDRGELNGELERALAGAQAAPAALALEAPRGFATRGTAARRATATAAALLIDLIASTLEAEGRLLGRRRRRTEAGAAVTATARSVSTGTTAGGAATEARPGRPAAIATAAATVGWASASATAISAAFTGRTAWTLLGCIHVEPTTADIALVEQRDGLLRLRLR
jgi:hypothetical protein